MDDEGLQQVNFGQVHGLERQIDIGRASAWHWHQVQVLSCDSRMSISTSSCYPHWTANQTFLETQNDIFDVKVQYARRVSDQNSY